jgi:hypothetical protein
MADLIGGLRQVIQDLVAPDLKAIQAKQDSIEKRIELQYDSSRRQMEVEHNAVMANMDAFRAEGRLEFEERRATSGFEASRHTAPLSERIGAVEKRG